MRRLTTWLAEISGLGRAFVEVLRAEWSALTEDLGASGRLLVRGLILVCVAGGLAAWSVFLLSLALIAFLERFLDRWAATAVVAAVLLLIAALILVWARSVLRRAQPPAGVVQSHVRRHLDWLGSQLGSADQVPESEDSADV